MEAGDDVVRPGLLSFSRQQMFGIVKNLSTNSSRLERWIGAEQCERISAANKDFYWPIHVAGVPGNVRCYPGGDFRGPIRGGGVGNLLEFGLDRFAKRMRRWALAQRATLNTGFASFNDYVAEETAGKGQKFDFNKAGPTGVATVTSSLWGVGPMPAAGANAAAAPGGEAPTSAMLGAFPQLRAPGGTDTLHFTQAFPSGSLAGSLLLYDRIFQVNKTMNSTATEAVTGVPTRYQSTVATDQDFAGGNFLFVEVGGTALAATAHAWNVCLYTDQGGAASTMPSLTGNSGAIVRRLDHPVMQFFAPLAAGDWGIKELDQMQCSAAVATGVINFVIGHPIAFIPVPVVTLVIPTDSDFSWDRIFDNAALGFLDLNKPAATATTYTGQFRACAG